MKGYEKRISIFSKGRESTTWFNNAIDSNEYVLLLLLSLLIHLAIGK